MKNCDSLQELKLLKKWAPPPQSNALLISVILLVGAFIVLSQQGLDLGLRSSPTTRSEGSSVRHQIPANSSTSPESPPPVKLEEEAHPPVKLEEEAPPRLHSAVRHLQPVGLGSYAFVHTGAYRTSSSSFAIVGLASKPFHVFDKPEFRCEWIPESSNSSSSTRLYAKTRKLLPDWGYGRVYTVVVLHCDFDSPVGEDQSGGKIHLHVGNIDRNLQESVLVALRESPGEFNAGKLDGSIKPKYEHLYCGSSLYGYINPNRMREWIAYHAMLFGPRSHFVLHDAGVSNFEAIFRVLEPWIKLGYVSIQDFREQDRFDGYYYNQFLVVNDCLFRHKFDANWMFFFDVDEYVYIPKPGTLDSVLEKLGTNHSQIMFEQNLMSHNSCVQNRGKKKIDSTRQWGFEKLVFKNVKTSIRLDRKYVLKPAMADSAGVHLSENVRGKKSLYSAGQIVYYHFHNTINQRNERCQEFWSLPRNRSTKLWVQKTPFLYDDSLSSMAPAVKAFELEQLARADLLVN